MKRFLVAATVSLALAACAGGSRTFPGMALKPAANPSAVIAAELGFARLAQDKGQWAAFRATAADGAEMFVPQRVKAADWLKGRTEPAVAVKWQPHAIWSSCDGSYAVTRGSWQSPAGAGHYATVWQRQNNNTYKWVADMNLPSAQVDAAPEMVVAAVADCPKAGAKPIPAAPFVAAGPADLKAAAATDNTLSWSTSASPDGTREIWVRLWKGGSWQDVYTASSGAKR